MPHQELQKEVGKRMNRIAGVSLEEEKAILDFHDKHVQGIRSKRLENEREKTPEEVAMIDRSQKNINELRAKYDLPPIDFSSADIRTVAAHHAVIEGMETGFGGGYAAIHQTAVVTDAEELARDGLGRFDIIQHELLHSAQYQALQVPKDTSDIADYRTGVSVQGRKVKDGRLPQYLNPLNEAITEENASRMVLSTPADDPKLGPLIQQQEKDFQAYKDLCKENPGYDGYETLSPNDVIRLKIDPETGKLRAVSGYRKERAAMWKLFDRIHEKNPGAFPGKSPKEAREAMFDMVTKASLDGNIMPFGRLMNDTFGRGTFRNYGHLQTPQEIVSYLDALDTLNGKLETPVQEQPATGAQQGEAKPEGTTEAPKDAETEEKKSK